MAGWEDLPDVEKPAGSSWESLPDVETPAEEPGFDFKRMLPGVGPVMAIADLVEQGPERLGRRLVSGAQGVLGGYGDELAGKMVEAVPALDLTLEEMFAGKKAEQKTYHEARDAARQRIEAAVAENPGENLLGAVAMPVPGPGKLQGVAKLAAKVGIGAGAAGVSGLGQSTADLTKGEYGQAAKDAGFMALLGGGLSTVGGVLDEGLGWARNKLTGVATDAADRGLAANRGVLEGQGEAALGKYRNMVQQASRDLEVLEREAAQATPRGAQAKAFLLTPKADELRELVVKGKLESAPGRVAEAGALKAEHQALAGRDIDQQALNMFEGQVKGVPKAALNAGLEAGKENLVSRGLGLAAAVTPLPGAASVLQAARGALSTPVGVHKFATVAERIAAKPQAFGRFAGPLLAAAARSPQAFAVEHYVTSANSPEYREMLERDEKEPIAHNTPFE